MNDSLAGSPLVSIVVPVYNGELYLRQSLDSILNQTYPHTEVLVMDDASTDDTPEIIASHGSRVRSYRQPQNRGQFETVNDGITMAQGRYICVFHADDVYHPTIVEREVEFLERYLEAGAVFCQDVFIDRFGTEWGRLELPPEVRGGLPLDFPVIFNALLKYKNRFIRGPSSMVRASAYRNLGPYRDEQFRIASDLEMWVRIARRYPIGILEEYLISYRWGHGNASQKYSHLRTEQEGYFRIMDGCLEDGGRAVATPDALAAYEAHRVEERLMRVINHYILGRCDEARAILSQVWPSQFLGSSSVQRGRLLFLFLALRLVTRLPRIPLLANLFYRRWHVTRLKAL